MWVVIFGSFSLDGGASATFNLLFVSGGIRLVVRWSFLAASFMSCMVLVMLRFKSFHLIR